MPVFAMGRQCHHVGIDSCILGHAYTAFSMLAFFDGEGQDDSQMDVFALLSIFYRSFREGRLESWDPLES